MQVAEARSMQIILIRLPNNNVAIYMLQGGLIATLAVEQHPSIVCALLLSGPALDVDPAFGSFSFSVLVRNNREMLTHFDAFPPYRKW